MSVMHDHPLGVLRGPVTTKHTSSSRSADGGETPGNKAIALVVLGSEMISLDVMGCQHRQDQGCLMLG